MTPILLPVLGLIAAVCVVAWGLGRRARPVPEPLGCLHHGELTALEDASRWSPDMPEENEPLPGTWERFRMGGFEETQW